MRRRRFSQAWVHCTQALVAVCLGLTAAARTTGAHPTPLQFDTNILSDLDAADLKSPVRFWEPSWQVAAGGGFKDNVALSHTAPERSAFFRSGLEATLARLPLDGTQVTLFLSAEDTRYFSSERVDHEDLAFAQAELRRFLGNRWEAAIALEGAFLDQVIDLSVTETNRTPVLLRGASVLARPGTRYQITRDWWTSLEVPVTRQYYDETLDDYWQLGPRLTLGRSYGNKSELSFGYEFAWRGYDAEEARDSNGSAIPNLTRASSQHEMGLAWKQHWDARRRWRTQTRLSFRDLNDNAGGYFNYRRVQIGEQVRWRVARWQISAEARYAFYAFPVQTIEGPGTPTRDRTDLSMQLRTEFQLRSHLRLYAQYDHESSFSNLTLDEYAVNTYSGGLLLEF